MKTRLKWDERYNTGVFIIDKEHKKLLAFSINCSTLYIKRKKASLPARRQ